MSAQQPAFEQLKELFRAKNISNVAIIDDAYYTTPPRSSFVGPQLSELRTKIQSWEKPNAEFTALALKIESDDDLTETDIGRLYAIRASAPEIQSWFRDFDNDQAGRRGALQELEAMLKEQLGCNVQTLSPKDSLQAAALPQLIFIDYYLDPSYRPEDSLELAEGVGDRLKQDFAEKEKPLVILMSSHTNVSTAMKAQFRDRVQLLGGMFHFIPKAELKPDTTLLLNLAIFVRSLDQGHTIQRFVDSFENELLKATGKFAEKIRALTIEDYAYMQHLSLQGEGMPLGDYLLWLFGTYFGHLLFRAVPQQRRELDRMRFETIPESDIMPSSDFAELYRSVVAEEIEELGTHPRASSNPAEADAPPDPHFGDVFIDESDKNALMVITAECDLMYAPEPDAERGHRPEQSVVMVPGELQEQSAARKSSDVATYFVPYRDKTYQIAWRLKSIDAPNAAGLRAFLIGKKMHRRLRIRHPFATQVQTAFATDLSRVGIPVAPPMFDRCSISICYRRAEGDIEQTELGTKAAVLYTSRTGDEHVHLKLKVAAKVVEAAKIRASAIETELGAPGDENTKLSLRSHKERLNKFLADLESQMKLRQPYLVRANKNLPIPGTPVEILRDPSKLETRLNTNPIVVLVTDVTVAEAED